MTMAVTAPAAPAFGASQRRGTKSQNSTSTGNAASSVDQSPDHNTEPWSGSSRCVYAQIMKADCRGAEAGCKSPLKRGRNFLAGRLRRPKRIEFVLLIGMLIEQSSLLRMRRLQ